MMGDGMSRRSGHRNRTILNSCNKLSPTLYDMYTSPRGVTAGSGNTGSAALLSLLLRYAIILRWRGADDLHYLRKKPKIGDKFLSFSRRKR